MPLCRWVWIILPILLVSSVCASIDEAQFQQLQDQMKQLQGLLQGQLSLDKDVEEEVLESDYKPRGLFSLLFSAPNKKKWESHGKEPNTEDAAVLAGKILGLKKKLAQTHARDAQLEAENKRLQAELDRIEGKFAVIGQEMEAKDILIRDLRADVSTVGVLYAGDIKAQAQKIKELEAADFKKRRGWLDFWKDEGSCAARRDDTILELKRDMDKFMSSRDKCDTRDKSMEYKADVLQKKVKALEAEHKRVSKKFSALDWDHQELSKKAASAEALYLENKNLKAEVGRLQGDRTDLLNQLAALKKDNSKLGSKLTKAESDVEGLMVEERAMKAQISPLRDQISKLDKQGIKYESKMKEMAKEAHENTHKIDELKWLLNEEKGQRRNLYEKVQKLQHVQAAKEMLEKELSSLRAHVGREQGRALESETDKRKLEHKLKDFEVALGSQRRGAFQAQHFAEELEMVNRQRNQCLKALEEAIKDRSAMGGRVLQAENKQREMQSSGLFASLIGCQTWTECEREKDRLKLELGRVRKDASEAATKLAYVSRDKVVNLKDKESWEESLAVARQEGDNMKKEADTCCKAVEAIKARYKRVFLENQKLLDLVASRDSQLVSLGREINFSSPDISVNRSEMEQHEGFLPSLLQVPSSSPGMDVFVGQCPPCPDCDRDNITALHEMAATCPVDLMRLQRISESLMLASLHRTNSLHEQIVSCNAAARGAKAPAPTGNTTARSSWFRNGWWRPKSSSPKDGKQSKSNTRTVFTGLLFVGLLFGACQLVISSRTKEEGGQANDI